MAKLLYFAWVREKVGHDGEEIEIPHEVTTPNALAAYLAGRGGGYSEAFGDPSKLRCAVDQTMRAMDAPLGTPNEIGFFPPVTGG